MCVINAEESLIVVCYYSPIYRSFFVIVSSFATSGKLRVCIVVARLLQMTVLFKGDLNDHKIAPGYK